MENASKALLIAGAILIAIVLISLGVMILGQGSDLVNNADMSEAEIAQYNSPFEAYLGNNVRGNKVRLLIEKVNQHNRQYSDDDSKIITITGTKSFDGKSDIDKTEYGTGDVFTVKDTKSSSNLITSIEINKK